MTPQEADMVDDAGLKPFTIPSGEPGEGFTPPKEMKVSLGQSDAQADESRVSTDTDEGSKEASKDQNKSEAEGKDAVENYSAKLQEKSEELYATELYRAKAEEGYLLKLATSEDRLERRMAGKILKRQAEEFGASNIEEFVRKQKIDAAGDDVVSRKLAEQDAEIANLKRKQSESDWELWKKSRQVSEDFSGTLDEIHSDYPHMPFVDVMVLAKGRLGEISSGKKKEAGSTAMGGSAAPESDDSILSHPILKRTMSGDDIKKNAEFAKKYFGS